MEKYDPQYQQWKEEAKKKEKAVELQEQAEVLAKAMKEQFDQTICALSPSLITPPQFPPNPPGVPILAPTLEEKRASNDLLGAPQFRWIKAEFLHKVSFGRDGVTKDEFIEILAEQYGDRRCVAALGEFITRHGGGVAIPRAKEACSGLVFDIARKQRVSAMARVRAGWGLCVVCGVVMFLLRPSWASIWQQTWSEFECFAEPLEFACVESEGRAVPLVRLSILGITDRVHT